MLDPEQMLREIKQRYQAERDALPETWPCERHGEYSSGKHEQVQPEGPTCKTEADATVSAWHVSWRHCRRWQAAGVPGRYQARTLAYVLKPSVRQWPVRQTGLRIGHSARAPPVLEQFGKEQTKQNRLNADENGSLKPARTIIGFVFHAMISLSINSQHCDRFPIRSAKIL